MQQAAWSSPIRYTWTVPCIFAVRTYMFKNWCFSNKLLREYSVYNLVSFCILLDNICFAKHTDLTQHIRICSFTDKQYRHLCSIWDIFILMRCVFLSPVKCYLQVLLSLHSANGEVSNKRLFTNFVCRFYMFYTSHTVFLPLSSKNKTVSHLVGVWNISNSDTFSQPRDVAMAWASTAHLAGEQEKWKQPAWQCQSHWLGSLLIEGIKC